MAIRIARFEVYRVNGDYKAARDRWHVAAESVQVVINTIWQTWESIHVHRGTPAVLRRWLAELKAWHDGDKESRGDKPKCPVLAIDSAMQKEIYRRCCDAAPALHARPRVLALNETIGLIKSRKAANGSLPGWMAILLGREGRPSTTHPAPVPFDLQCSTLHAPLDKNARFRLTLRTDRYEARSKSGAAKSDSHLDELELLTNRRGIRGHEARLWRVIDGQDKLKGSALYFDRKKSKWFALLAIEQAAVETTDAHREGYAILCPGRDVPFVLWVNGQTINIGRAEHVADVRRAIIGERRSRQNHYRHGQRSSKGHGRRRAIQSWDNRLMRRWRDFQTTYNHDVTKQALRICAERGVAKLIYLQPAGHKSDTRCLSNLGKMRSSSEGWAWFQVATLLNYKAEDSGIQVEARKCDASGKKRANIALPRLPSSRTGKAVGKRRQTT